MKKIFCVLCVFSAFTLTGCNTVKGVGADIQKGGEAISNTASEVESSM